VAGTAGTTVGLTGTAGMTVGLTGTAGMTVGLTGTAGTTVEECAGGAGRLVVEVALEDPAHTAKLAPRAARASAPPATMARGRTERLLFVVWKCLLISFLPFINSMRFRCR
jgi:hypothetical protein